MENIERKFREMGEKLVEFMEGFCGGLIQSSITAEGDFECDNCHKRFPFLDLQHHPEASPEDTVTAYPGGILCDKCFDKLTGGESGRT